MLKIINGKKYDTSKAKYLASWHNDVKGNNFLHVTETLFRKKTTGEFFLYAWGGAWTKYAHIQSDGWRTYGERIIPLTQNKAKKWVLEHCPGQCYIKIFGDVPE